MSWFKRKRILDTRLPAVGDTVAYFTEEGCQAMSWFHWVGVVRKKEGDNVFVEVIKRHKSYGDFRDHKEPVIKKLYCPKNSANMRMDNLGGVWIYTF